MAAVAVLLISLGAADLARCRESARPLAAHAVAAATVIVLALLADLHTWPDLLLLAAAAATGVAWVQLSTRALRTVSAQRPAIAVLAAGIAVQLVCAGAASHAGGVLGSWLHATGFPGVESISPDRFLLLAGLFLVQISVGNTFVRLVLGAIGAIGPPGRPGPSDRLKGGRLLGPMERIFILGLGLAGTPTAAALVIAAKGIIRFPELNARRTANLEVKGVGIDEVTEYFLVGSFLSWLVALFALGLAALA